jgi:L-iditol 2-dehydrogenase
VSDVSETVRQAYVPTVGRIEYRQIEVGEPGPDEVLIEPARIGICGSDVHVYKGEHPIVQPPLVQGHEVSGTVIRPGPGVSGLAPGDIVTIEPAIGCGHCSRCAVGLIAQCADLDFIGGNLDGPAASRFVAPAAQIVRMRPTTSLDHAALAEPLATAVHAARRAGEIYGHDVLVTGGGPIGGLIALVAREAGARQVVVSDPSTGRRRILDGIGLATLDGTSDVADRVEEAFDGREVTIAFECSGVPAGLDACIQTVGRGCSVVVVAVYAEPPRTDMIAVQDRELDVHGSLMYTWADFREAARLIDEGTLPLDALLTHHVPFDSFADGYAIIDDPAAGAMKVLVDIV